MGSEEVALLAGPMGLVSGAAAFHSYGGAGTLPMSVPSPSMADPHLSQGHGPSSQLGLGAPSPAPPTQCIEGCHPCWPQFPCLFNDAQVTHAEGKAQ